MTTTIKELLNRREQLFADMENYIREVVLSQPDQEVNLVLDSDADPEDEDSYPIITTFRDGRDITIGISSVCLIRNQICISGYDVDNGEMRDYCEIYPAIYPDILDFLAKVLSLE